jgi:hypothetical protein
MSLNKIMFEDSLFESKDRKDRIKTAVIICIMVLGAAALVFGITSSSNAAQASEQRMTVLISANYKVDGVGPSHSRSLIPTLSISSGGVVHTCQVNEDNLKAKKPIHCSDGVTIHAKK